MFAVDPNGRIISACTVRIKIEQPYCPPPHLFISSTHPAGLALKNPPKKTHPKKPKKTHLKKPTKNGFFWGGVF
jgi:hypothetical protein